MKRYYILLLLCFLCLQLHAQEVKYVYRDAKDSTHNFYVKLIPSSPIKGLLVLNNQALSNAGNEYALEHGVLVVSIVPRYDNGFRENMVGDTVLHYMDTLINEVLSAHKIPADKVIIGGLSAAGTGAVRYAQYCAAGKSVYHIKIAGVFAADPPLDYERMWYLAIHTIERKFHQGAVAEAQGLKDMFISKMGGPPGQYLTAYQQLSPYSHTAANGGNAGLLNHAHVRLYTEPDVNWWIENRRKDYYDMNALDLAGLVNQLKLNGNDDATLITTENKGYNGTDRHPHAWSIIDQKGLIDWCLEVFNSKK
ncbi:hypothetical protein [Chitinophaga ginsengisoli]|uniref:Uncharacterized protein n=1 Tax=Chitinophaga ginsengisoli TaxID=363837 RepID=A0A2P8GLN6_9BACT|nr:hypothetical protein [Chitinophaga ginsengisoli]PSL34845.1 hypothetical protein CLV42_102418 [Chitinophaga ginsengisoli]